MRSRLVTILVVFTCFVLLFLIQIKIDEGKDRYALLEEMLYFPSGTFIEEVSLGYNLLIADLVWIRAIQYFGEHHLTDLKYLHLYHILDILTTLDRKFIHGYTFGGFLLEHSAQEPDNADRLLHKGEFHNPHSWEIPFVRGFIYYIFRGEKREAIHFFLRASRKPAAPEMCKRFASFTYQKLGDKYMAFKLWQDIYENTTNRFERETAERYMKEMYVLIQLDSLNVAFHQYGDEIGRYPSSLEEMEERGFIKEGLYPPWEGESYYIDKEQNRIWCTYLDRVRSPIIQQMINFEKKQKKEEKEG
jgi:hypothetical protein